MGSVIAQELLQVGSVITRSFVTYLEVTHTAAAVECESVVAQERFIMVLLALALMHTVLARRRMVLCQLWVPQSTQNKTTIPNKKGFQAGRNSR